MVEVNYLAIFASAVSAMVWGSLWYGPLFGKPWMKMVEIIFLLFLPWELSFLFGRKLSPNIFEFN